MDNRITRRQVLARVAGQTGGAPRVRLAPRDQLVNTLEFEEEARRILSPPIASVIADRADRLDGSGEHVDRQAFDRITLRPRMLVPALDLDLTVTLFGDTVPAPIAVAPIADQKRFHPDGEAATVRGASLAKAPVILSSQSSIPLTDLVAGSATPIWYQVFASDPAAKQQMRAAADAGCRAICLTVGVLPPANGSSASPVGARVNWGAVGVLASGSRVPVIVKGVMTPADATAAIDQNAQGVVVSNYGGAAAPSTDTLIHLPAIVDAVAGRVPVLVDGGFRRGTDILKALAFGAQAVAVGRPVMWGLAAYGADGVRAVIEMLQTELARYMAMCGRSRLDVLSRDMLRVHAAAAPISTGSR